MTSPTFPSSPSSLSSTSPSSHDTPYQLSHLRSQSRGRPSLSSPVLDEHPPDDSQTIDIRTGPEYDRTHPLPELPPLPPAKSFHHKIDSTKPPPPPTRQATFIENWIARHPRISRHRRRFALIVGISVFLVILTITLLAVFLGRNSSHGGLNPGLGGDWGGGGGGGGGDWDDGSYTSAEELRRYNKGKQRPPINRSNAPGWTNQGRGEATYYEPSLHSATGGFQPGACEFEYINSVYDHIAALNKADFGSFARLKNSPACGQCLRVVGPNGTVDVQVVDMCPGCKSGDVDLTPSAFAEIADIWRGRVKISWQRCT
ncbi:hypothetical protein BGW38_001862 [Lunasporangiospora selenospora]|uniref:RlpA-like double-psi beta-barrel-protein domain-containing protein-containing protein n=1 Tax=Lunasporangiospora selenospora TaxID=979761 RepID=A0A9P6FV07_9FUNG|nr:hypothetical protein BGW38_001862 [Lunasporangiospora selenospora]